MTNQFNSHFHRIFKPAIQYCARLKLTLGAGLFFVGMSSGSWSDDLYAQPPGEPNRDASAFGYLTATDDLGRTLPHYGDVPEPREDRYVGLFYFLWLGQHSTGGPYDITRILAEDPDAVYDRDHPLWGPVRAFHHWGEPLFDYYFSDDSWVLRRHAQMLTMAEIDFLVFDVTNRRTYAGVYNKFLEILEDVRQQGWDVPKVVFYTNTASGATVTDIYEDLYKPGRYPELWFHFEGKPLIIGNPDEVSEEVREFFTFRLNQWPVEPMKPYGFPWISFRRPQEVFYVNDEPENVNVAVAVHNNLPFSNEPFYGHGTNWSRSFRDGARDTDPDAYLWGYNFSEQWEHAIDVDPRMLMVTGWNEWVAQRFNGPEQRPIFFVDQATLEFSRDVEPMKGGYNDNYYLQMIDYIRQYKGLGPQSPPSPPKSISMDGDFSQWEEVRPTYRDFVGGTEPRRHPGFGGVTYTDDTGRNDFEVLKVARDEENIYFYARTAEPILRGETGENSMMLFINSDGDGQSGWKGYQFVANRTLVDDTLSTLEVSRGGWDWEKVGELEYRVSGNELHLAIPRPYLDLGADQLLHIEFKWVDNMQNDGEIMDFYLYGDAAPYGRLNYLYTENPELTGRDR